MLTDGDATFEYHAGWLAGTDAIGDFVQAARRAERTFDIGRGAARGGDGVAFNYIAIANKLERVGANIYEEKSGCGLDTKGGTGFSDPFKRCYHV